MRGGRGGMNNMMGSMPMGGMPVSLNSDISGISTLEELD